MQKLKSQHVFLDQLQTATSVSLTRDVLTVTTAILDGIATLALVAALIPVTT
ncbi:MAG: hypothetical protein ACI9FB_000546 [Candidatus Azotimanducaceae bacterium]|jgi:hypothetical protein